MSVEGKSKAGYLEMAILGSSRAAGTFFADQAFDRMKVECQRYPEKTTQKAVSELFLSQGVKGFYSGALANFTRRIVRETYHWPAMLYINRIWKDTIPTQWNNKNLTTNLATGNSMALVHAGFTLPFERLLIERIKNGSYRPFLKQSADSKYLLAYEGFNTTWIRHSFVWNLFFLFNHLSTAAINTIDPENTHPYLNYVGRSLLTSQCVVAVGYPAEFIQKRILMEPEILSKGTFNAIRTLFYRYKWAKLYSGAPVMFLHNSIQTLFIQMLIDKMNGK